MKVKTYEAQYELREFNLYIDHSKEDAINVADLVIESNDLEFIEKEFNNTFVVDTDKLSYVFSDYELNECYKVGDNLIHIICVK